jgi:RNA polymerase subunit RPABC4/transcription elongation factor Spt4
VTLTKCPNCGHTVLSVASQCPACAGPLTSTFLGLEHQGELAECRSCGRPVRSRTAVCPHCGIPKPAGRRADPRLVLPLLAAGLLAVMAVALRDRAFRPARADSTVVSETALAPAATPAASQAVEAPALVAAAPKPRPESTRTDTPAGQPARAVDSARPTAQPTVAANSTLTDLANMDSAALLGAGLERRWTVDWSNMHRTPRNGSPIVRVLPPGTEVHVAQDKWGWWAILWKGDTVGYIAGALLRANRRNRTP